MGSLFGAVTHSRDYEIIFLSWAEKHPYLFTLIEVTSPSFYIILAIVGFNMVGAFMRGGRKR